MTQKGESERRPALPPDSDLTILTCRPCAVDVSVEPGAPRRCPRCAGPLDRPSNVEGDAPERTLLEVRAPSSSASSASPGDLPPLARKRAAARSDLGALANTATQPGTHPSIARAREPEPGAPEAVRRVGQYELRRVLGKGGMGVVYEAWQPSLGRAVALKVMSAAEATDEELERFDREARAAARLQHPNIVPIYDVGAFEGRSYFTMDLVRGRTLQELARQGTLDPADAARIVARVCRAIHYAHEKGIIHRDLKPSNVLVDEQGEPHVTDFGLAKDVTDQSGLTLTGVAMGSPPYMPPEQAKGEFRRVDAQSDVYGLGTILYECLTGSPPFTGKSVYDIIAKVLVEEPVPPRRKAPAVPVDLETICLKALEKEKWRRYPTAEAMAQDLERHLAGRTIEAIRHGFTTRIGRGIERHRWQIVSALVPVAIAAGVIGYLVGGEPHLPAPPVAGPPVDADPGPIARAGQELGRAVEHLSALGGPTWRQVITSLDNLPADLPALRAVRLEVEPRLRDAPDARASWEVVRRLVDALATDPDVDPRDLAAAVSAWYGVSGPLAEVATAAVLAHRGAVQRDPACYRLALAGPRTPIDVDIVREAARSLGPLFQGDERAARAVAAVTSDAALAAAALRPDVVRLDATRTAVIGPGWVFPPVTWPGAPAVAGPPRPVARGLVGRGARDAPPTAPLVTGDGARVLVGWLRFLHVLDAETGGVVRRVRLPGAARGLQWHRSGRPRVRVWDGARVRDVLVGGLGGGLDGAVELRWLEERRGAELERPVSPLDLLPAGDAPAIDELRRVAFASFPALDDRLDVFAEHVRRDRDGAPVHDVRVARVLRLEGRPALGLTLSLSPEPDAALAFSAARDPRSEPIAARVVDVSGPAAQAGLRAGDVIVGVERARGTGSTQLELRVRRGGAEHLLRLRLPWPPVDLAALGAEAAGLAARDGDPNPWHLALAAGLRPAGTPPGPEAAALARAAALSPHLGPVERVELGCFLDERGLEQEAERAFTRALADLLRDHAYAPALAGYAQHDAGRALADRVVEHRLAGRAQRAEALARWRDAFAPALAESDAARAAYARRGADVRAGPTPPKGVAGLDALDLLRLDHAVRLQGGMLTLVAALLALLFLRYGAHARRDLARMNVVGARARLLMWVQRPWTRLTYTWPAYISLSDKLAFIALYLVYFAALSVQDAGLDVLAALRRGHEPLLAGVPAAGDAVRGLGAGLQEVEEAPDPARAYAVVWALVARGETDPAAAAAALGLDPRRRAPDLTLSRCEAALRARGGGRDHLLLAELALAGGSAPGAVTASLERAARDADPEVAAAAALLEGDHSPAARERLAAASTRQRAALEFTGEVARPLAPPPSPVERDWQVVGRARWWTAAPSYLLRNLTQPIHTRVDASLLAFEEAWSVNLVFSRLRSDSFFLVPASVLVLVIALLVRTMRPFEPLQRDLRPGPVLSLLGLLVPGVRQISLARTARGLLLLAPFLYVSQALVNARHGGLVPGLQELTRFDTAEVAALTGEVAPAIRIIETRHTAELVGLLLLIYLAHGLELLQARRRFARAAAGPGAPAAAPPVIVPVDSEPVLDPPAEGPFDRTEPGG
ncbi:MAG: protein kinase [Planctomycetes bacterium]|nr:protein kinase [Planctomycetota bacterium]